MENIKVNAYAKLNLSLNLFPEILDEGFFKVHFINTQLFLHDTITLEKLPEKEIKIKEKLIPKANNLAFKAVNILYKTYRVEGGVSIDIMKNIPIRAGLGGGSCDAAAVINGFEMINHLAISKSKKLEIAKMLGMDVCYSVIGGLCFVKGIGDIVERLPYSSPKLNIIVANPHLKKPSTKWAYSLIDNKFIGKDLKMLYSLIDGIKNQDLDKISQNIHNDFEIPINKYYSITRVLKEEMINFGAINAMLCGSGLSVFGIYKSRDRIQAAKISLEDKFKRNVDFYITETVG